MLDVFLLMHQRKNIGGEDAADCENASCVHIAQPLLFSRVLVCTNFFPDAEVADEKAALQLIDIKQCRLRLSQSSSDRAPPLLNLRADRSLSHDHPSSKQSSAPSIIVKAEGYHKMVSHMSPNRALIKILLKAERIVGSPDQSVPSVALTQIVTPIATGHHGTPAVTTSVLPDLSDWAKFVV